MVREISAGGAVVRHMAGKWWVAVIEPRKESPPAKRPGAKQKSQKVTLALPKGLVDPGEKPEATARREIREETGVDAELVSKLTDIKYVYTRSWGDRERVFKIVSFYLFRYRSGEIGRIAPEMEVEVKQALWLPLEEAAKKLAYGGEKDVVRRACEYVAAHPDLQISRPPAYHTEA
jgi:8-oxo-dGTP pyrophosphatase MutT (NUDIX family)